MRILTVRQPWAWAIIHGTKSVENRSRNIAGDYRGTVAIHAAASKIALFDPAHPELWPFNRNKHTLGAIIGVVNLWAVHKHDGSVRMLCCPNSPDRYTRWAQPEAWHLCMSTARPLAEPIPFRGALGLRRLDEGMVARVEAAIA